MQPLFVDLPERPDVQLDRCATCGGLWFDYGELEDVTGKHPKMDPLDGADTSRRCPRCQLTLAAVFLGATPVETCSACRGVWLDFDDVGDLGSARLSTLAKPPPPQPDAWKDLPPPSTPTPSGHAQGSGFECAVCRKRAAWTEARGTAKGLVCGGCTPDIQPIPRGPELDLDEDYGSDLVTSVRVAGTLARWWLD